jgi:hypothetical protein
MVESLVKIARGLAETWKDTARNSGENWSGCVSIYAS